MKWITNTRECPPDQHRARCGHLYVRIDNCQWYVEPDDEDKSYRRALATGVEVTVEKAKEAAAAACEQIVAAMFADLRDLTL